jgi:hypothetical protein
MMQPGGPLKIQQGVCYTLAAMGTSSHLSHITQELHSIHHHMPCMSPIKMT